MYVYMDSAAISKLKMVLRVSRLYIFNLCRLTKGSRCKVVHMHSLRTMDPICNKLGSRLNEALLSLPPLNSNTQDS